jgi:hypothetical protein
MHEPRWCARRRAVVLDVARLETLLARTFSIGLDAGRGREKVALVRLRLSEALFFRVRCRSGASRGPPVRTPIRSTSRANRACGGSSLARAAASSMASGKPSSRRQISATAPTFWPVSLNPGATAWARTVNSCTAAYRPAVPASGTVPAGGTGSGGTGTRARR